MAQELMTSQRAIRKQDRNGETETGRNGEKEKQEEISLLFPDSPIL
jgi:hypothetical protein